MYEFRVNIFGNVDVAVVAESKEEACRILDDTINSISIKDLHDKLSPNKDVDIKESNINVLNKMRVKDEREESR